ncbi:MAG: hypothetical protein U0441_21165 [Polyangiaceae bacterium]
MSGATFTLPGGHAVTVFGPETSHGVQRTPGGAVIASLGASSDDADAELAEVARALAEELAKPHDPARVLNVEGALSLSQLTSRADAPMTPTPSPVLWCLHAGTPRALSSDPRRLQAFLRVVHRTGAGVVPPRRQVAHVVDAPSDATRLLARWLQDLGVEVWFPEQGATWIEIARPTGEIDAIRAGSPYPAAASPRDAFVLRVNAHKDRAESTGDAEALSALEDTERAYLAQHTAAVSAGEGRAPFYRAPQLTKLVRGVEGDADPAAALVRLARELLGRAAPLVMTREPDKGFGVRVFGEAGKCLSAFVDIRSAEWMAEDLEMEPGKYEITGAPAKAVLQMAARGNYGVALCAFEDRSTPMIVILPAALARSLTDEKLTN